LKAFLHHAIIDVFFRQVDFVGIHRIPSSGPVIFVANHNNQFVDPMMLIAAIDRVVRFLIAAKSLKRPIVGALARGARAIGVERPQDIAKKGSGTLTYQAGSTTVLGDGTSFMKDLHVGAKLKVGDTELAVKAIVSDTECTVGSSEENLQGVSYKVMPRVDQTAVYTEVHNALKSGDCIGIFPEGGSHDRASLLDLKPGVAIMALGAMQAGAGAVKIVPCGLNYFEPHRFRSRVIVEFGEPFEVPEAIAKQYESDKRRAVQELMTLVDDAMKGVMPGAADYGELQALLTMRALYKPRGKKLSPEETLKLNKMFALTRAHLDGDERMSELMAEVTEYVDLLRAAGLRDRDVRLSLVADANMAWKTLLAALLLIVLAPLSIPTAIVGLPIAALTATLAKREKAQALAASTVKVKALDVVASYKIIIAIVFLPVYNLVLSLIVACWLDWGFFGFLFAFFIVIPVFFFFGIRACDLSVRCLRRCRATLLFWGCRATAGILQQLLVERRARLEAKVRKFVEEFGPLVSEDLQEQQVLQKREITGHLDLLQKNGVIPPAESTMTTPLLPKHEGEAAPPPSQEEGSSCVLL